MKKIVVSQRVEFIEKYDEKRDCLDQRWSEYFEDLNILAIAIPNNVSYAEKILKGNEIDGVLLTGGNSLVPYGGTAPERDILEIFLLEWAMSKNIPLLGVCRGMQLIQHYYGINLVEVDGHIGKRHKLNIEKGCKISDLLEAYDTVNSYHRFGAFDSAKKLDIVARSGDGVIMSIEHAVKKIYGIMWHCERENPFSENDKALFRKIFCQ